MNMLPKTDLEKLENTLTAGKVADHVVDQIMERNGDEGVNPLRQPGPRTPDSPCTPHHGFRLLMTDVPELQRTIMNLPFRRYPEQHPEISQQVAAAANDVMAKLPPETVRKVADTLPKIREKLARAR